MSRLPESRARFALNPELHLDELAQRFRRSGRVHIANFLAEQGVEEFFRRLLEHEEVLAFTPEEFIDGGDTVAVLGREHCRARATGRDFTVRWVHVFQGRGGRLVRFREYIDTAPMVEAYQK